MLFSPFPTFVKEKLENSRNVEHWVSKSLTLGEMGVSGREEVSRKDTDTGRRQKISSGMHILNYRQSVFF